MIVASDGKIEILVDAGGYNASTEFTSLQEIEDFIRELQEARIRAFFTKSENG
jgi:hypothetical protein